MNNVLIPLYDIMGQLWLHHVTFTMYPLTAANAGTPFTDFEKPSNPDHQTQTCQPVMGKKHKMFPEKA